MECESPAEIIACAVRDAAQAGPFEIWAYLVVPAFIGLVTLAVAIASFTVARASHTLSKSIVDEGRRSEVERLKIELAERVFHYALLRWPPHPVNIKRIAKQHVELEALSLALAKSEIPGADEIERLLREASVVKINRVNDPLSELPFVAGYFTGVFSAAIQAWFRAPEKLKDSLPEQIELLRSVPARAAKNTRKRRKKAARKLAAELGK